MLLHLSLNDFVIVDALNLDFENGFTVLTGETGAGKSITLDAIGLLLGDKADYTQIRHGRPEARLSALFDLTELPQLQAELRGQGLLGEDETELSLRRIIDTKGKSRSFINQQTATLAQLKHIGSRLIDIHGQNAHHSLNSESQQRKLLDAFSGSPETAAAVRRAWRDWQNAAADLKQARQQSRDIETEREKLAWQLETFDALAPQPDEWAQLSQSHDQLATAAERLEAAEAVREYIDGDKGVQSLLYRCQKHIAPLADTDPRFAESLDLLAETEAQAEAVSGLMRDLLSRIEINPEELAAQEERMGELMNMARKHRIEPEHLHTHWTQLQQRLETLEAAADLDALQERVAAAEAAYRQAAAQLSDSRRKAADTLAAQTTEQMQGLSMQGAQFAVALLPCPPSAHGLESVQFQVAANRGTPLRPLNKVASGGELARISLALQVVCSRYTDIPTLIFDEVDTGIGGGVAQTVGRALRRLGGSHQVLAVTHLPQVAACGLHHWKVAKHDRDGQTVSTISLLDENGRTEEIARMLGGETLTETTRRHAAELLAEAGRPPQSPSDSITVQAT